MIVANQAPRFADRTAAGQALSHRLQDYADRPNTLILALPRGGVTVAAIVARALQLPLDLCLVRKLGVPGREELAMGAIGSGGVMVFNSDIIAKLNLARPALERVIARETQELQRRDRLYRGERLPPRVSDQTVILIDDGIATGATMRAAIAVLQPQKPAQLIVAVPVAPREVCADLVGIVDEVICLCQPEPFYAIGAWYDRFDQVSDAEVIRLLEQL